VNLDKSIGLRQSFAVVFLFAMVFVSLIALHLAQQAAARDKAELEKRDLVSTRTHQLSLRTTEMLARVDNVLIIDTRPKADYVFGHLAGATYVTLREQCTIDLSSLLGAIRRAKAIVICGRKDDLADLEAFRHMVGGVNWNCYCCPLDRKAFLETSPREKREIASGR
jgi:hypothetical protein